MTSPTIEFERKATLPSVVCRSFLLGSLRPGQLLLRLCLPPLPCIYRSLVNVADSCFSLSLGLDDEGDIARVEGDDVLAFDRVGLPGLLDGGDAAFVPLASRNEVDVAEALRPKGQHNVKDFVNGSRKK